jgi:hypothetical protein
VSDSSSAGLEIIGNLGATEYIARTDISATDSIALGVHELVVAAALVYL